MVVEALRKHLKAPDQADDRSLVDQHLERIEVQSERIVLRLVSVGDGVDRCRSDIRNLFLFVGADPATDWLAGCGVMVDRGGFVVTGAQCKQKDGQSTSPLETSVPGVFAVGDVRSGSVKRVGGAIGEGAQVVAALHGFLADAMKPSL